MLSTGAGLQARRRRQRRALWVAVLVNLATVTALTVLPGWTMTR